MRDCQCLWRVLQKIFTTNYEQKDTEQEIGENEKREQHRRAKQQHKSDPDSNGIRAEDIKATDDETREMVRQIFNEIIQQNECTPEAWKKVRVKVIRKKKGNVEDV